MCDREPGQCFPAVCLITCAVCVFNSNGSCIFNRLTCRCMHSWRTAPKHTHTHDTQRLFIIYILFYFCIFAVAVCLPACHWAGAATFFDDITLLSANAFNANVMLLVVASDPKLASLQNDDARALVGWPSSAYSTCARIAFCTHKSKLLYYLHKTT